MSELNATLTRRTRGLILKILEMLPFVEISLPVIRDALVGYHCPATETEIGAQLTYLEEKGYVKVSEDRQAAEITAAGVDLLEGSVPPDPGVMLP